MRFLCLSISFFVGLFLLGCSSSSTNQASPSGETLNGALAYPNLLSAYVCIDANNNSYPDDEVCQTVSSNGAYSLYPYDGISPLAAVVNGVATPQALVSPMASTNNIVNVLAAPKGSGGKVISIFTTYIKAAIDSNPLMSIIDAQNQVKTNLGIPKNISLINMVVTDPLIKSLEDNLSIYSSQVVGQLQNNNSVSIGASNVAGLLSFVSNFTQSNPIGTTVPSDINGAFLAEATKAIAQNNQSSTQVVDTIKFLSSGENIYNVSYHPENNGTFRGQAFFFKLAGGVFYSNNNFHSGDNETATSMAGKATSADFFTEAKLGSVFPGNILFDNASGTATLVYKDLIYEEDTSAYDVNSPVGTYKRYGLVDGIKIGKLLSILIPEGTPFKTATAKNDLTSPSARPITATFGAGSKKFVLSVTIAPYNFAMLNQDNISKVGCAQTWDFVSGNAVCKNVPDNETFAAFYKAANSYFPFQNDNITNSNGELIVITEFMGNDNYSLYNTQTKTNFVANLTCVQENGWVAKDNCSVSKLPTTLIDEVDNKTHPLGFKYWQYTTTSRKSDGEVKSEIKYLWVNSNEFHELRSSAQENFDIVFFNEAALPKAYEAVYEKTNGN